MDDAYGAQNPFESEVTVSRSRNDNEYNGRRSTDPEKNETQGWEDYN